MKKKVLIIDDEPLAISLIQRHLLAYERFEVANTASNAIVALEILNKQDIDLIFCDINMPSINGLDFLKILKTPAPTIITTAHREYALEAYELDIIDYLLKPITTERFMKSIDKYNRLYPYKSPVNTLLKIKVNNTFHRINANDIFYIESQKDYVRYKLLTQEYNCKQKISDLEVELAPLGFLRVHRSFLVNCNLLEQYTSIDLKVGSFTVPIGHNYKDQVIDFFEKM